MTTCPTCADGVGIPLSGKCEAKLYLLRQCPIMKEVNVSSKHACPDKECPVYLWKTKEEE
jgi:hypothetical protein